MVARKVARKASRMVATKVARMVFPRAGPKEILTADRLVSLKASQMVE